MLPAESENQEAVKERHRKPEGEVNRNMRRKEDNQSMKCQMQKRTWPGEWGWLIAAFIGIGAFLLIYGMTPLDVTNDAWIMAGYDETDIIQHYSGWLAFRNSDWTFPLGIASDMAVGQGTCISYTDSIPWVAIVCKLFRGILPETFRYFAEQGVAIKVISGDNPLTVSQIALEAGIDGAEAYIDAATLDTEEAVQEAAARYTVFGRVTPEQKRQLVRALQSTGHTVGMTGDGVNDVLALKEADCSVAMASGCDAAAQVSQLVLLESDFSTMPSVVAEGRRVVNNIQRSASLFLVKNIFSFLMAVFSACFMLNYPLEPSQISLISMFTIGIPGFFLALQPNGDVIHGRFLPNVLIKALPAGLTDFLVVGALVIFGRVFGVNETDISTACTMLLAIVGFMILHHISKPLNLLRWIVWAGCIAGLLICSIYLGDIFGITHMSMECVMLFGVFAIATESILRYGVLLVEKISGFHAVLLAKRKAKRRVK